MMRLISRGDSPSGGGAVSIPDRVHLVGAGGIMMSGIGQILLARGHTVTGSDLIPSEHTARLVELGATVYEGHAASNLGRAELLVATAAAREDNPEIESARARNIPVMLRAEMVRVLLADRRVMAIAGTHGKTTTTTLAAMMAVSSGLDPLVLVGGDSPQLDGNARDGAGDTAVVEADEYAEAFLQYDPMFALITNIEADHLDYYGSEERMIEAFHAFAARVVPEGTLIVCADSPLAAELGAARREAGARVERYAVDADAEWRAERLRVNDRGGFDFTASLEGAELGAVSLQVPGRHNVANALGAMALAMRAGVDFNRAARAAEEFSGVARRFDTVGEAAGVTVIDEYAHHPTEVRVNISAARQRFAGRRLVACFQPHTYSRTKYLLDGWRDCFEGLDVLYLLRTYAARETEEAGLDARALAAEITTPSPEYVDSFKEAVDRITPQLAEGDVFLTIGAGDVTELAPMVLARLERGI
ncbi:MAG: UDP-N-acetylmuramate--L-alanine ligase [Dehalococcoidia bacterium]|jgi:UDP-N-acetylmuramate--alanine ligase|nr:UDP-N-acetylmuramate--L-alanine ligase [Dehalococcoidia bacterium]